MAAKLEHVAGIARAETNLGGLYVLKQDSNGNGGGDGGYIRSLQNYLK